MWHIPRIPWNSWVRHVATHATCDCRTGSATQVNGARYRKQIECVMATDSGREWKSEIERVEFLRYLRNPSQMFDLT